ncbi:MAG: Cys-tRNA(Pro) deacylase [Clostridia bacterium]|nr:Cys-tRNA(Pro) deacylase [Clostridia bacterium]
MSKKDEKTNVMRVLEQNGAEFESFSYSSDGANAEEIAKMLGQDPLALFKTLVAVGKSREHYVFMIPSCEELDLKKAAAATGEKSVEMIPQKELLPLTGYVHGGCSPIGMRKQFDTFIDETSVLFDRICFSGGKVGFMVKVKLSDLLSLIPVKTADLIK